MEKPGHLLDTESSQSEPPRLGSKQNDCLSTSQQNESRGAQKAEPRVHVCKITGVKRHKQQKEATGPATRHHTPTCQRWHPGPQDGLDQTHTGQYQAPSHRLWMISVTLGATRHHGQSPGGVKALACGLRQAQASRRDGSAPLSRLGAPGPWWPQLRSEVVRTTRGSGGTAITNVHWNVSLKIYFQPKHTFWVT